MAEEKEKKRGWLDRFEHLITHDMVFRTGFALPAVGKSFLRIYLPKNMSSHLDFKRMTVEERDFTSPSGKETHADILYTVPALKGGKVVQVHAIIEHKSGEDISVLFQMFGYAYQFVRG
jgi:deferrochelatase/peroxidase EfeB